MTGFEYIAGRVAILQLIKLSLLQIANIDPTVDLHMRDVLGLELGRVLGNPDQLDRGIG